MVSLGQGEDRIQAHLESRAGFWLFFVAAIGSPRSRSDSAGAATDGASTPGAPASSGLPRVEGAIGEDVVRLACGGVGLGPSLDDVAPIAEREDLGVLDAAPVGAVAAEGEAFFSEDHRGGFAGRLRAPFRGHARSTSV